VIVHADRSGSVEGLKDALARAAAEPGVKGLMVLACDGNGFTPQAVDAVLGGVALPLFGGIFPEIIQGQAKLSKGTVVAGLTVRPEVRVVPGLSDPQADYEQAIDERFPPGAIGKTLFVFVDGLASRIGAFVQGLYDVFGMEVNYVGGGAGSLSLKQKPCLMTNAGLTADAGLLALVELDSGVGVSHGWTGIGGPFRATRCKGNVVETLDHRPAFDVYRGVVEEHSGKRFGGDNFFEIAKSYPLGIGRAGSEYIVRDPLMRRDDGALVCVGEVPEGSLLGILWGQADALVEAARHAAGMGREMAPKDRAPEWMLFVDCISRVLFLGDEFSRELAAVAEERVPMVGALTIGEIANSGRDYLEFYNKTAVVAMMG
jgi:hypothetical protein